MRIDLRFGLAAVFGFLVLACGGGGGGGSAAGSEDPGLRILTQPANASILVGQTATFTVVAAGSGPLGYQWWRDGAPISGAGSASYTTPAVTLDDSGSLYHVVARDGAGATVASQEASLLVSAGGVRTQHYVDPNFTGQGDGSFANPWNSLQDVLEHQVETRTWEGPLPYTEGQQLVPVNAGAPVKPGDTIWLRSGYYGALTIQSQYNAAPVTIAAEAGNTPRFSSVLVRSSQNWTLRGLSVSPSHAPTYSAATIVTVENHSWRGPAYDVVVDGCQIFSVPDERVWTTREDWDTKAASAFYASGARVTIRGCSIRNINFGISLSGQGSRAERNTVDGFCGDGLRGLGDDEVFEYNLVKNRRDVNDNHPDGFQSWSVGTGGVGTGVVRNIQLRGNVIIGYEDPAIPFVGTLQGIGCFDGVYDGWVVENNVIITDHWHGISFYGARNVRLVNNTVLDLNDVSPGPPYIRVTKHKNGTPSSDCVVRNNLTTALSIEGSNIDSDHNLILPASLTGYFVDSPHFNVRLAAGSPAIDQGSASQAPALDADGSSRPKGAAFDVGAYEYAP